MEANELRIGNYVNTGDIIQSLPMKLGIQCAVTTANQFQSFGHRQKIENVRPILLTEKGLLKFGFKITWSAQGEGTTYELDNFLIHSYDFGKTTFREVKYNKQIVYIHQLQNLYFALTGKELTLDQ